MKRDPELQTELAADDERDDLDLCAILGHDPYWDEPNHCGRCDAQIDGYGIHRIGSTGGSEDAHNGDEGGG